MTKTRISTFPDRHPLQIIGPSVWFLSLWEQKRTSIYQIFKAQCLRLLNETLLSYITLQLLAPTLHETWESCQPPLHFWKFTKADQAEHLMTHEKKNRWLSWSRLRGTNRFNLFSKWSLVNPRQTRREIDKFFFLFLLFSWCHICARQC